MSRLLHVMVIFLLGGHYYQCPFDTRNHVHEVWRSGGAHDVVLGTYTQAKRGDQFIVTCTGQPSTAVSIEWLAQQAVESCR